MIKKIIQYVQYHLSIILLILILIGILLFVNMLIFDGDIIAIDPQNAFRFSLAIDSNKLKIYLSIIPILTLIFVYLQWHYNSQFQKISEINGLLEELRHNINLSKRYCDIIEKPFYYEVYKEIQKFHDNTVYPTHLHRSLNFFKFIQINPLAPPEPYVKLRNDFISSAISSRSYFHIKKHRIFLNLGHLNYSILRHNRNIERYLNNSSEFTFRNLQEEYLDWLHFRLHFMLIDLINNVNEMEIIDKEYINKIKSYLQNK